jgi:ribonuclease Y
MWVIPIAVGLAGVFLGILVLHALTRGLTAQAREQVALFLKQANERAAKTREEIRIKAGQRRRDLMRLSTSEIEEDRRDLTDYEADLAAREEVAANREKDLDELQAEITARQKALFDLRNRVSQIRAETEADYATLRGRLEERAEIKVRQVIDSLLNEAVVSSELKAQMRVRDAEAAATEDSARAAARIMALAVDRYDGIGHLERIQNSIAIESQRLRLSLSHPESPLCHAFVEAVGCELNNDDEQAILTVRGDDPLAREVARRLLRQIANRGAVQIDLLRRLAAQVRDELEHEVQNAGRKAVRLFGLSKIHPEIVNLVGRLKFRLSYSQNQLKHSVEVAYLAGMMAAELGLDVEIARRGGLLHDIGKAMTHDHEGSHAVLGAQVARRCGESEVVANAIGAHHNDEPVLSPLTEIVTAADALSGARPGARRESVTQYINRIQELQRIANRSPAVRRVDIMQAGREVRVIVAGEDRGEIDPADVRTGGTAVSDAQLQPLAKEIAEAIEQEVAFAGQIRVTVIRESRSIAVAH